MEHVYSCVTQRFLRDDERLMASDEKELPLVLEAKDKKDLTFLHQFLNTHSKQLREDIAEYGAVLLRGFAITSDEDFERSVLSIEGLRGISEAFMSEYGRVHVGNLQYVLHTNAVYKTGGTLYLGGFHSENYYNPDVPSYICFCCLKPSSLGGETGLVNTEKVYQDLDDVLKMKLEQHTFFTAKWLIKDVAKRYRASRAAVEEICKRFDLPIIGKGDDRFVLMYKPSVFLHPETQKKALQINLFELPTLNAEMRKCFMQDYPGKTWFWHRFIWRMPTIVFSLLEFIYVSIAAFCYSPKTSYQMLKSKWHTFLAERKKDQFNQTKVGTCFTQKEVKTLAKLIRKYYVSCLWQKGDVLLVDNRKVIHAGMPGAGPRLVRAMICNPLAMRYSYQPTGCIHCQDREGESVGFYMAAMEEEAS